MLKPMYGLVASALLCYLCPSIQALEHGAAPEQLDDSLNRLAARTTAPSTTTFSIPTAATAAPSASPPTVDNGKEYIQYSTVGGFFLQDLTTTNASTFDYTAVNFGLINQTYKTDPKKPNGLSQWERFNRLVFAMNQEAPRNVVYKLLFIGRHGEGYHNAAETFYGTPAWNCYYAEFDGNSTVTWSDAHLTPAGVAQAMTAHNFWAQEFKTQRIQAPQSYYVSPLSRCLQTAHYTYHNLPLSSYYPFKPKVKEFLREGISIHTCDRRSSKTYIQGKFPRYQIEDTFTEDDELWNGITSETTSAQEYRSKLVLDEIFSTDPASIISITTHSGEAGAILADLGHIPFSLNTGEIIPVFVKAVTIKGEPSTTTTQAWTKSAWCTNAPPVSSQTVSPYKCICSGGVKPTATTIAQTRVSPEATQVA